jgi:hypothetical protein
VVNLDIFPEIAQKNVVVVAAVVVEAEEPASSVERKVICREIAQREVKVDVEVVVVVVEVVQMIVSVTTVVVVDIYLVIVQSLHVVQEMNATSVVRRIIYSATVHKVIMEEIQTCAVTTAMKWVTFPETVQLKLDPALVAVVAAVIQNQRFIS